MNRTFGKFLVLGVVALAAFVGDSSTSQADWPWWGGYPTYSYGVGYYPYGQAYSTNYWPSSYYVGYGSYSLYPSYGWSGYGSYGCGTSCCGSSGCGTSCCGSSFCGSPCGGCSSCGSSGCCGSGGCGFSGCGSPCGGGCGLACGPSCGGCGAGGCGTAGSGCGATTLPPGTKPKPVPDEGFTPRTYDPDAPAPRPGPAERPTRPAPATAPIGGPPAATGTEADPGTGRYSRDRSGDGVTRPPATQPKDNFDAPVTKPAPSSTSPPGGTPKDTEPPFNTEAKKPLAPVQQRGTDKKAPIATPDDDGSQDVPKSKTDLKKPSAENPDREQPQKKGPALTLQDRSTWHLTGISRPLFGQIARNAAPLPERLSPSTADWAVFSADEAQVVRR
jgi:hypothetical protein